MNSKLIRERWHRDTSPFAFRLSDGSRVPVAHPDFMAMAPGQIFVIQKSGRVIYIDPLHVVAIEDGPQRKSKGNGRRGR